MARVNPSLSAKYYFHHFMFLLSNDLSGTDLNMAPLQFVDDENDWPLSFPVLTWPATFVIRRAQAGLSSMEGTLFG